MTDQIKHRDDHVLIVTDLGEYFDYKVECPNLADGPQRRAQCAYWEACAPCTKQYRADRDLVERLVPDVDLEMTDWIDGTYVALDDEGKEAVQSATIADMEHRTLIRIDIPEHEECPIDGLSHHAWEGDVVASRGQCCVQGDLAALGRDLLDYVLLPDGQEVANTPGRYVIAFEAHGEDGLEISVIA